MHGHIRDIAKDVLTIGQLEVFELVTAGHSIRATAARLDVARTTASDRYDSACRRLRAHGVRFTPDGHPYLEEHTNA